MSAGTCPCSRCTAPEYARDDAGRRYITNNLHGELQPCEDCGRPKTEYVDRGTWGYYECWWCSDRAAGAGSVGEVTA